MILAGMLLTGAAGAAIGSYVTTAALRASVGEGAAAGRSRCDGCRRPLRSWETVPVVSYAVARGGCRACGAAISPLHPLGEVSGAAVGVALWALPAWPTAAAMAAMGAALLAASVIDVRTMKLPDALTAIVAVSAAILAASRGLPALAAGTIAAAIAVALLGGLRWAFARRGRDPGLGFGDVKLIAALALWLGALTPWMVAAAAFLGLIAAGVVGAQRRTKLPFGPMLAASGWICGLGLEAGWWRV